ncbi:nucleotidyl transferase AbiEii/AbiGii toxin family protein [Ensifer sp. P24N7]|uniref:nucleotidyl transferase AbiEii/AbiGii toxin family protein n=1 Tax=Sinorhizobium sp. P24N7 TaxID=3348358 RepID=UPI0035F35DF8
MENVLQLRELSPGVEERFGYVEMPLLSLPDLYAGKICAALDRQHPRDLFDVKLHMENEGLTPDLIKTFIVYLISHNRTMGELARPVRKDISGLYEGEFLQMAQEEISLDALLDVRERLIVEINKAVTDDQKRFLISFKSRNPDWSLLGVDGADKLPAVRWKMQNLERMPEAKHEAALQNLRKVLQTNDG